MQTQSKHSLYQIWFLCLDSVDTYKLCAIEITEYELEMIGGIGNQGSLLAVHLKLKDFAQKKKKKVKRPILATNWGEKNRQRD